MVMSFLKFAILSTMGEMIGLRISTGVYINRTFGIIPGWWYGDCLAWASIWQ